MRTNKDIVFVILITLWLISNITSFILYTSIGITFSNFIWILLLSIMVGFKLLNKKFNNWLETEK